LKYIVLNSIIIKKAFFSRFLRVTPSQIYCHLRARMVGHAGHLANQSSSSGFAPIKPETKAEDRPHFFNGRGALSLPGGVRLVTVLPGIALIKWCFDHTSGVSPQGGRQIGYVTILTSPIVFFTARPTRVAFASLRGTSDWLQEPYCPRLQLNRVYEDCHNVSVTVVSNPIRGVGAQERERVR
jgi:hypothetical protein